MKRESAIPVLTAAMVILVGVVASGAAGCGGERGSRMVTMEPPQIPASETVSAAAAYRLPASPSTAEKSTDRLLGPVLAAYSLERQFAHIEELASDRYQGRRTGSAGARAAASYISAEFATLGLKPWSEIGLDGFSHNFSLGGFSDDNIIGVLPGTGSGYVILAAHYDHLGIDSSGSVFNGADDNAAGVAAMLEAARIISQTGMHPVKNVVFCAFSGEEQGQLGASALGALISSRGLAGSVEMINIDGIGAVGGSYFGIWDQGAVNTGPLVASLREAADRLGAPVREEGTDVGSDARPFVWQFGIAAVTVDWHWGTDESEFHPYYHTVDDTPEKINQDVLAQASKVAIGGLWLRAAAAS
ncbi:MAG: M20/M25/M40 family metallo-hydrolase [Thermoleophilia bacterium]|nr:M20/M25/M40 family metallo-hydrolase [Thermoleophilia bacterium]